MIEISFDILEEENDWLISRGLKFNEKNSSENFTLLLKRLEIK